MIKVPIKVPEGAVGEGQKSLRLNRETTSTRKEKTMKLREAREGEEEVILEDLTKLLPIEEQNVELPEV
jgi:hypothetical protein